METAMASWSRRAASGTVMVTQAMRAAATRNPAAATLIAIRRQVLPPLPPSPRIWPPGRLDAGRHDLPLIRARGRREVATMESGARVASPGGDARPQRGQPQDPEDPAAHVARQLLLERGLRGDRDEGVFHAREDGDDDDHGDDAEQRRDAG